MCSSNSVWMEGEIYRRLTPVRPTMWQAEADTEMTLSASPVTAVGQLTLTLANWRYSTVCEVHTYSTHHHLTTKMHI